MFREGSSSAIPLRASPGINVLIIAKKKHQVIGFICARLVGGRSET